MDLKKIIKLFYVGYTIYALMVVNTTSIKLFTILPALLFMWVNYLALCVGYSLGAMSANTPHPNHYQSGWFGNRNKMSLLLLAGTSILFSVLAVKYYTGQTPSSLFVSLRSNISVYYEYQEYFKEQQRGTFSIAKLPFIFMLFYVKLITYYSYMYFFISRNKLMGFDKLYISMVTLSFLYTGMARGTNIEFFEFIMLVIFIILLKRKNSRFQVPVKSLVSVLMLIGVMVFVFYLGISARGVNFDFNISQDVSYDSNGILPRISPLLSFVTVIIFDYFGFGFYYLSIYISSMWFSSIENLVAGFIPFGYLAFGDLSLQDSMRVLIDMGARWHPDSAAFVDSCGYIGLLMFCFSLGVFSEYLQRTKNNTPIILLTTFMMLLQMISFPVGSFITSSSAGQLIALSLILYWSWNLVIKGFFRRICGSKPVSIG